LWNFLSTWFALRLFPRREGTIRSSGRGSRSIIWIQPPCFQSASRVASTGWTGTARGTLVFTDFSIFS